MWRGVVAAVGGTAMITGLYPLVPHAGMLAARARTRRGLPPGQLRSLLAEWAASMAVTAARPIGFLGLPVTLRQRRGPRPVILIHGYAMNRANFLPLARRLVGAGLGPLVGFEYWTLGSTSAAARRLGRFVEQVCEATGAEQVDLVGHSMGGVVGRYYLTLGEGAARVRNLVTIGSPHGGTESSMFGFGRPTSELMPGSNTLQRLEAARFPPGCAVTAIWSRSDALVTGARSARLRGVDEIVYEDLGHVSMLFSRRVAADVIERLRRG
jgi:pimeloyl-ACP methyl ester carboxylesterase